MVDDRSSFAESLPALATSRVPSERRLVGVVPESAKQCKGVSPPEDGQATYAGCRIRGKAEYDTTLVAGEGSEIIIYGARVPQDDTCGIGCELRHDFNFA